MRVRPLLSALAVALLLVVGLDYVSFAANGHSLLLGRKNVATKVTTVKQTGPGPALALKVRPGSPPLAVSSGTKVRRLNADSLDGLDSAALTQHVSGFVSSACESVGPLTSGFAKLADIGTFTTGATSRWARIEYGTTYSALLGPATGVIFELRVDGQPTTVGQATYLARDDVPRFDTLPGVFQGLAAGQHTLSVWARSAGGNATQARVNQGCFAGANQVLVTEFR